MLADALVGTGYIVLLTDQHGRLVDVAGELQARLSCSERGIEPGADLSEQSTGTSAVGTVIADGRALQMLAGEHFCDLGQNRTCTGAPFFRGEGREVGGVLCLSGDYRLLRSELIDVVMQGALDVEDQLAGSVHA
jgi:two-component system sensor histidine kinase KdpD